MEETTLPYHYINIIVEDGVIMERVNTEFRTHILADGSEIKEKIETIRFRRSSADDIQGAIRKELMKMLKDG